MHKDEIRIIHYTDESGNDLFQAWLELLDDSQTKARVLVRLGRVSGGNFGDWKSIADGVHELRLDFGAGFRVYFAREKSFVVLLLAGGTKRSQKRDIQEAIKRWKNWQARE